MPDTTDAPDYATDDATVDGPTGVRVCAFCALWHTNGDLSAIDFHVVDAAAAARRRAAVLAAPGVPSGAHVVVVAPHAVDAAAADGDRCDTCAGPLAASGVWYTALLDA